MYVLYLRRRIRTGILSWDIRRKDFPPENERLVNNSSSSAIWMGAVFGVVTSGKSYDKWREISQ